MRGYSVTGTGTGGLPMHRDEPAHRRPVGDAARRPDGLRATRQRALAGVARQRDGIGPRAERPRRINVLWGGGIETNSVGTHEFFDFLELIGAEAYINGNIGSGTPQEMADWLEYMTGDRDSTLVRERQRNGREHPWKVAMFGIGNETWACGGNMRPEYSADLHKRYRTFLYTPPYATFFDPKPENPMLFVASGGNGDDYNFTKVVKASAT